MSLGNFYSCFVFVSSFRRTRKNRLGPAMPPCSLSLPCFFSLKIGFFFHQINKVRFSKDLIVLPSPIFHVVTFQKKLLLYSLGVPLGRYTDKSKNIYSVKSGNVTDEAPLLYISKPLFSTSIFIFVLT